MHLAGPREVCVYYVFERCMDRGVDRGCGRDSTRNESGLERETNMTSRREIPLSVYMQGGVDKAPGEYIFFVWCLCWYVWVCEDNKTWGQKVCHHVMSDGPR